MLAGPNRVRFYYPFSNRDVTFSSIQYVISPRSETSPLLGPGRYLSSIR